MSDVNGCNNSLSNNKKYHLSKNSDLIKKFLKENSNSQSTNDVVEEIMNNVEKKRELANISQNTAIEMLYKKQQRLDKKIENEQEGQQKEQDIEMSKMYSVALEFLKNFFTNKIDDKKKRYVQQMSEKLMQNLQNSKFLENAQKFVDQNIDLRPFIEKTIGEQAKFAISSILQDKEMAKNVFSLSGLVR